VSPGARWERARVPVSPGARWERARVPVSPGAPWGRARGWLDARWVLEQEPTAVPENRFASRRPEPPLAFRERARAPVRVIPRAERQPEKNPWLALAPVPDPRDSRPMTYSTREKQGLLSMSF
jgi:hypothetical protein